MNREMYRKILIAIFAVYLSAFIYYLFACVYTSNGKNEGAIPTINQEKEIKLVPLGIPAGIYIRAKGVMVLDTGMVTDLDGVKQEPTENLIKKGDYIVAFNGQSVDSIEQFNSMIQENESHSCTLTIMRNDKEVEVKIEPVQTGIEIYKLGIWVRQDAQGIGTLTFVEEEGNFGALGHGITDVDTNETIEIQEGRLYGTDILAIVKGKSGEPGELVGDINYYESSVLGKIETNNESGIFGFLDDVKKFYKSEKAIPAADHSEVKEGPAFIRCYVDGECMDYGIEIENVDKKNREEQKDMVIKIVDERLLEKTNGIVQGMSGSPIIQDGKLVGAVTHVLVNDPTRGYGIFIENMLDAAG